MSAVDLYYFLSHSRSSSTANFIIYIEALADDWRITLPASHFKGKSAGGAGATHISLRIHGDHADGVVVVYAARHGIVVAPVFGILDIDLGFVL